MMKLLLILLFTAPILSNAQDTIFLATGDTIIADISRVSGNTVIYTEWGKSFVKQMSTAKIKKVTRKGETDSTNILCQWEENKTDEFTGYKILTIGLVPIFVNFTRTMSIGFRKIDENYYLTLKFIVTGSNYIRINKEDQLMLKLSSDTIIKMGAADYYTDETVTYSGISTSYITPNYPISREQMELLSKNLITKLRFYTSDGYIEEECNKEKNLPLIKKNAKCMIDAGN